MTFTPSEANLSILGVFKKGPFHIAKNTGITIVPIALIGAFEAKRKDDWKKVMDPTRRTNGEWKKMMRKEIQRFLGRSPRR